MKDHAELHVTEPSREYDTPLDVIHGTWPANLRGHAFIIGPTQPTAVPFVWVGPGIVTRVDLEATADRRPHWISKFVVTPEIAVLGALAMTHEPQELAALAAGSAPCLTNTSMHFLGPQMLLTHDPGRPALFDPVSLTYRSYVGGLAAYPAVNEHPLFANCWTTAHPVEDPDEGCMWWCNQHYRPLGGRSLTDAEGTLHIVRWRGNGEIDWWAAPGARIMQGIHEVACTQDYVIFCEVGFQPEMGAIAGMGQRTKPHMPWTDIYLVAKRDLTDARKGRSVPVSHARVPREAFHQFADYEQEGDDIVLYVAHSNGQDVNFPLDANDRLWHSKEPIPKAMIAYMSSPSDASPVARYVIDGRTGEIKHHTVCSRPDRLWGAQLYGRDVRPQGIGRHRYAWQAYGGYRPDMLVERQVQMYAGNPYRIVDVDQLPEDPIPSAVACHRLDDLEVVSSYAFPEEAYGQSPIYAPDTVGDSEGWVLSFVQFPDRTELYVFDATELDNGPVAIASAPGLKQSYQVHSAWVRTLTPVEGSHHFQPYARDLAGRWESLPAKTKAVVKPVIDQFS